MPQAGADEHQDGVAIREVPHYTSAAEDLPVEPLNYIVGADACPVLRGEITLRNASFQSKAGMQTAQGGQQKSHP